MGGMIAQIMATEHPERVLSLTSLLPQASFLSHSVAFARRIPGLDTSSKKRPIALSFWRRSSAVTIPAALGRQIAAMAAAGDRRSS